VDIASQPTSVSPNLDQRPCSSPVRPWNDRLPEADMRIRPPSRSPHRTPLVDTEHDAQADAPARRDRHELLKVVRARTAGDSYGRPRLPEHLRLEGCQAPFTCRAPDGRVPCSNRRPWPNSGRVEAPRPQARQPLTRLRGGLCGCCFNGWDRTDRRTTAAAAGAPSP